LLSLLGQFLWIYCACNAAPTKSKELESDQIPHCLRAFFGIEAACRVVELGFKVTKGSI